MRAKTEKISAVLLAAMFFAGTYPVPAYAADTAGYTDGIMNMGEWLDFEEPPVVSSADMAAEGYTQTDAYEIDTAGELAWFVQHFYAGDLQTQNVSLAGNIDLSALNAYGTEYSWTPIGYYSEDGTGIAYNGYFDGNGYTVRSMVLDSVTENCQDLVSSIANRKAAADAAAQGLDAPAETEPAAAASPMGMFGYIGSGAVVTELGAESASLTVGEKGGAVLSGVNQGTIRSVMVKGALLKSDNSSAVVSEICGKNQNTIIAAYASGTLENRQAEDLSKIHLNYAPGCAANEGTADTVIVKAQSEAEDYLADKTINEPSAGITISHDTASGENTYELNAKSSKECFQQNIGVDEEPKSVMASEDPVNTAHVYRITLTDPEGDGNDVNIYSGPVISDKVFAYPGSWQYTAADMTAIDVTPGMAVNSDMVLTKTVQDADAWLTDENLGNGGWRIGYAVIQAPDGYLIGTDPADVSHTAITVGTEGQQTVEYYLADSTSGTLLGPKYIDVSVDCNAPLFTNAADGEAFCQSASINVSDAYLAQVTVNGQPAEVSPEGVVTVGPAEGAIQVSASDQAGNTSTINIYVNSTHTFEGGVCTVCGAEDPDYISGPQVSESVPDAVMGTEGRGIADWYRVNTVTLTAPEGYRIAQTADSSAFGNENVLTVYLQPGENQIGYYLLSNDNTVISTLKTAVAHMDTEAPVISGLTEGTVYCGPVTFSISDAALDTDSLPPVVADNGDGTLTLGPTGGPATLTFSDLAGNTVSVNAAVNEGHTFENGICTVCGAADPDYNPGPSVSESLPDASIADPAGNGWYNRTAVTLLAPEGYYINRSDDAGSFGTLTSLDISELIEGENIIDYYVMSQAGDTISTRKNISVNVDLTAPVTDGLTEGMVYCGPVRFSVSDAQLDTSAMPEGVSDNGDGTWTLAPAEGVRTITFTDLAGNTTSVNVTVNSGHTFEDGVCTVCGAADPDYNPGPSVSDNVPDASVSSDIPQQNGWYRVKSIQLNAPEGYCIASQSDPEAFTDPQARTAGGRKVMTVSDLTEGENRITYYLLSDDRKIISGAKELTVKVDTQAPVITGAENGKTYCVSAVLKAEDPNLNISDLTLTPTAVRNEDGTFTVKGAAGVQKLIFRDYAGNEASIEITVNETHSFGDNEQYCSICKTANPDYKETVSESDSIPDASVTAQKQALNGWYPVNKVTLNAPAGYYISRNSDIAGFGSAAALEAADLQEGENTIEYYLLSTDQKTISPLKKMLIRVDTAAPSIAGAEDRKVYCEPVVLTITDAGPATVTVNGANAALTPEGTLTVNPAAGEQVVKAADQAGNETSLTITVNSGHSYLNGLCTVCGEYDPNYTVNVDAVLLNTGLGADGWYMKEATLQAPAGFYISLVNNREEFGKNPSITFREEGNYIVEYYLMHTETGAISQKKSINIKIDATAPVITGVENGKTYCLGSGIRFSVTEANPDKVTVDNTAVTLTDGGYTIAAPGSHTVTVTDKAGNQVSASFLINADHTWNQGVIQKAATPQEKGIMLYTCNICGASRTAEIPVSTGEQGAEPSTTLAMPTNTTPAPNPVNQILGIDDPSGVIGIVLISLGVIVTAAIIGVIVLIRKRR